MKKILIVLLVIMLYACDKNEDTPQDALSQLPPATQNGANTFGALINGEVFIPSGGINPLDCVYQLINGERYFTIDAARRNDNFNLISLSISTNARELIENQTYLLNTNEPGNAYGQYFFSAQSSFTNDINTGNLTITKLDLNNQIVSGTFFFDVVDQNGILLEVRDGRFDVRFTQ
jgi:hypothetical protein